MADEIDAALNELRAASTKRPKKQLGLFHDDEIDSALNDLRGIPQPDETSLTSAPLPPRKPNKNQVDLDQLHLNLQKAAIANPTEAARKAALSKALNLPVELLPPDAEAQAFSRINDPVALLRDYPEIANYLNQADNASIGGKNIENLKSVRKAMYRAGVDPIVTTAKGVVAVPETLVGIANIFSKGKAGKAVEEAGVSFKNFKERLDTLYSPEQKAANAALQKADGFLETAGTMLENPSTIAHGVIESVPSILAGGAVAQTLRRFFPQVSALVAGATGEGTIIAGQSAEKIRQQTESGELSWEQTGLAVGTGVLGGSVGVLSAKLMQKLGFGDIDTALASGKIQDAVTASNAPRNLASRILAGGVGEGVLEEMPQSAIEQIAENIALGKIWDEGVGSAMAAGLLTGAAVGAGVQMLGAGAEIEPTRLDKELDATAANALGTLAKAVRAQEEGSSIGSLIKAAQNDPMRREAPEAFKDFVRTMADEDNAITDVYVNGDRLDETLKQSGIELSKQMPTLARDIQIAKETGGDVRIAIEDFATHVVGTGAENNLLPDLKTDPEGMTLAEAQQFHQEQLQEFGKQAEEIIKSHEPVLTAKEFKEQEPEGDYQAYLKAHVNKVEAFAQDAQQVHDKVLGGMNRAGRFNRFVNEVYAVPFREFYAVNAAREGIMPSELYARLPLNFSKMQIEGAAFQQPGTDVASTVRSEILTYSRTGGIDAKLDYSEIEQRPDTNERQRELGRSVYADLAKWVVSRGQGTLLGAAIAKDFKKQSAASLIGWPVQTTADLAALAQVLRDPRYETFRVIYVKDGAIVHQESVTARLPAAVPLMPRLPGETQAQADKRYLDHVSTEKARIRADGYFLLHNHPSGKSTPSKGDIYVTKKIAEAVPGFLGHVVIDSNEYSHIDRNGGVKTVEADFTGKTFGKEAAIPHDLLESRITRQEDVAAIGKQLDLKDEFFHMIGLSARGAVNAIAEMPYSALQRTEAQNIGALRNFARRVGAPDIIIIADSSKFFKFQKAVNEGLLLDVVDPETGASASGAGGRKLFDLGKERLRTVAEDVDSLPALDIAARNLDNFDLTPATVEDFTKENITELLKKDNWTILTAENPKATTHTVEENLVFNSELKAELDKRGLQYESVWGMYPGDVTEAESFIVYGIGQTAAHELGNKYGQDSVLTREGLVYSDGMVTPVKFVTQFDTTEQADQTGYTRVPRTGAIFTFDLDWSKEKAVKQGAMSFIGTHYSSKRRPALEGKFFGGGLPSEERFRIAESADKRIKTRVDFYADLGNGIKPEAGLGSVRHNVLLHNIYNGAENPLRLKFPSDWLGANEFEKAVLDAGYDGYYVRQAGQGRIVVMGEGAEQIPTLEGMEDGRREARILSQQARQNIITREADGSLHGLPRQVGGFNAKHSQKAEEVTIRYMQEAGLDYRPVNVYVPVNAERAQRIAQAFTEMKHEPQNAEVKKAYAALIAETKAQYEAVLASGLKVEFIDFEKTGDPYEGNPRKMTEDVINNNHMWVFSTRDGFGTLDFDPADSPLLGETEFTISGQKALANDLFRVVHDYFGHVKEGVGFRAAGEENAWRAHMTMFSPLAGRALTTETRGQNSWVNYGPFAEQNRTASGADTVYADQKIGLLPEWVSQEGAGDEVLQQSAFFSALEREIPGLRKVAAKDGTIKPDQAKAWIAARQKEGKFKKEEIEAIGINDWLDGLTDKISVTAIEEFVKANGIQIRDVLLGGAVGTKFSQYVLPGGEGYRELLLTMPEGTNGTFRSTHFDQENILAHIRFNEREVEPEPTIEQLEEKKKYETDMQQYKTDILRLNKGAEPYLIEKRRTAALYEKGIQVFAGEIRDKLAERIKKGELTQAQEDKEFFKLFDDKPENLKKLAEATKSVSDKLKKLSDLEPIEPEKPDWMIWGNIRQKVLFIEEIQSDWAQTGRIEGFAKSKISIEESRKKQNDIFKRFDEGTITKEQRDVELQELSVLREGFRGVPLTPFVGNTKSWTALAFKRMLRYAAENGFDMIAWTTGAQQADRYDLRKHVEAIRVNKNSDGTYQLGVQPIGQNMQRQAISVSKSGLADMIGKELASKVIEQVAEPGVDNGKVYSGLDLKIGGEGMSAFYDNIVPQVVNDVMKKLGGGALVDTEIPEIGRQPSIDITSELRGKIMQGLPLFQDARAGFNPQTLTISLLKGSDLSSVAHEGGHFYLEALANLAAQPNATQQVKDDFRKTLEWFGVKADGAKPARAEAGGPTDVDMLFQSAKADTGILKQGGEVPEPQGPFVGRTPEEAWANMTLEQKRPYHEQWAQSFERYALEGKAPTLEMQPVFQRFRAWMLSIYKSLKEFLKQNPLAGKLNDEIRRVFDRLIASEEAIAAAEKSRSYAPLFSSAEAAGLTPQQYQDYLEAGKAATEQSIDELNSRSLKDMKWLSSARSKILKKLQAEAKVKRHQMQKEVEQEIAQEPVERAKLFLAKGQYTDDSGDVVEAVAAAKLSIKEVRDLMPDVSLNDIRGMTAEDGISLDLAGQMFGFGSGEELLNELINGESTHSKVQGRTDQRMLEENGDLIDDRALENAADEAVHNEARARFMATGLRMLVKMPGDARQIVKAAKQAAESVIAAKLVREIKPGQYAAAETRSNKLAIERAPTDRKGAADAQRAALLNNKLYAVSRDAQNEVQIILRYVKKFEKKELGKAVDYEYLEQINDLLKPFNFKNKTLTEIDKTKSLAAWVNEQEANGFQPAINVDQIEDLKRKHYKNMTLEELRGLRDTIKQIEHLGRYKHKLLTARDKREFQERIEEADKSIRDNANRTVKERGTPTDILGLTGQWARQFSAMHRKFSSLMREMDGGKDNGIMWNLLSRGMNDAGNQETEMRQQAAKKMAELFKMIKLEQGFANLTAKKRLVPGTRLSLTHEQRIMFGMNWGNAGNRQRLMDGGITGQRAISIQEANAIIGTLTKDEWDFIQTTWDYIGTYKDQIAELERKMTGVEPTWIEPAQVVTKYGTYRGGYFPAKYDAELSTRSETLEAVTDLRMGMKGAFGSSATRNGYTQERAKAVIGRPILLSFNVIPQHVNEVIHRLSWQPWLTDANRVLKALDLPIREHYGTELLREMRRTVEDIATGDAPAKTAMEAAINRLRIGSTIVGMGWKVTTALLQPTGIAQSYVRIGPKWATKGLFQFLGSPLDSAGFVDSKSSMMRNRGVTMQREINEVLNTLRAGETASNLQASYFIMIGKMQRMVDIPTWLGAYEKGLATIRYENAVNDEQRKDMEEQAAALADQAVLDSQSGGMTKDLAGIQRGSPLQKLFTNFYSYFSATYNLNVEAVRKTNFLKPSQIGVLAANLILLNIVPVMFSLALKEAVKGECDQDFDCLVEKMGQEQVSYLLGQMIGLREIGSGAAVALGADQYGYQGPAGLRFFSDLYKIGIQTGQGELDMPLFKSINNAAGTVLHYPAGQINATIEGIIAVEEGRVDGVSILPALIFGPPRE